jgi:chromosome segregation ATPase
MTIRVPLIFIAALALLLSPGVARESRAAEEDTTARLREMLHRTQEALRQAQSDNADLARSKLESEQRLQTANRGLEAARGVSKAELALRGQLQSTRAAQDDLSHKLGETAERLTAAGAKLGEAAKLLAARDTELAQVRQSLEQSHIQSAACETKNLKLYSYSEDLLQAYRKKGVWASLAQKDPVLGLKEVDVENVVQEYRAKFAGQKVKP